MTDKELVKRLRLNANCMMDEWEPTLCKRSEFITAADRIEQLRAELTNERIDNTNLIGELATVAAERDRYKAERENTQPSTNAAHIRAMSDEELADIFLRADFCKCCEHEKDGVCNYICAYPNIPLYEGCKQAALKWMKQPAEEER